jgi:hypothetical protein
MRTLLWTLLAITTLFALLTSVIANGNEPDFSSMTMREIATAHGWSQPHAVALSATLPSITITGFDSMTMREIASTHGWNQPEPVALTSLPQFADATIEHLTDIVSFVANRYYDGDVIAACDGIYEIFASDAQMNRVISLLIGS